jgi:poly(3-hydroxybutyrate) depolymerase
MRRKFTLFILFGFILALGWMVRADVKAWIAPLPEAVFTSTDKRIKPDTRSQSYTAPVDTFAVHRFKFLGHTRRWHSYVPENIKQPTQAVILLHGSGRNGASMIDMWQEAAETHGLVLIAPDSREEAGWSSIKDGAWFLGNLLVEVATTLNVTPETWFLFGHSAGAVHALTLVEGDTPNFTAVALHAGGPAPDRIKAALKPTPFRIYIGDNDPLFPVPYISHAATRLAEVGYPTELVTLQDHGHWFYDAGPKIALDAADWFLQ